MTQKRAVIISLMGSLAITGAAYAGLHLDLPTLWGNLAVAVLLPGILADMWKSGNPHSGSGGATAIAVTLAVSVAVWFALFYLGASIYRAVKAKRSPKT